VKAVGGMLGFGKDKDEKKDAKKLDGVKGAAQEAVMAQIGDDVTPEKAASVLPGIVQGLTPMGLKSLTLGPADEQGTREILAEASPKERIASLIAKKVTVGVSTKITFKDEASPLEGMMHGPKSPKAESPLAFAKKIDPVTWKPIEGASPFSPSQQQALEGANAALLPSVGNLQNFQPQAGYVVAPAAGSNTLELLSWNSSEPVRFDNLSHAEKQAVEFLKGRPDAWLKRVSNIFLTIEGRKVCKKCNEDTGGRGEVLRSPWYSL